MMSSQETDIIAINPMEVRKGWHSLVKSCFKWWRHREIQHGNLLLSVIFRALQPCTLLNEARLAGRQNTEIF